MTRPTSDGRPDPSRSRLTALLDAGGDRTPKRRFPGGERTVAPEETLARLRPFLARAGITRLSNITGLDTVGIPVTLATRPNGRVLSVSAGKGLSISAALVSAAMESMELHHAEVEWSPVTVRRSYDEMQLEHHVPDRSELPLARAAPFPGDWPYLWTWGCDLVSGDDIALPVSMVHMGNRGSRVFDLFSFQVTSNGLASGNVLVEAVHAALLEVIERDAATCHAERWRRGSPPPLVDLDAVTFPTVRDVLDRLTRAKVLTVVFDCSVDTQVPVYMANVMDTDNSVAGTFSGFGAHLDPEIAMTRAITEAVQARTVTIAGSRDDLYRHREVVRQASAEHPRGWEPTLEAAPAAPPPPPSRAASSFEDDLEVLVRSIESVGLRRVVVFDLSSAWFPMSVVKVVVPGLEGYRMANFAPGPRATAFARTGIEGPTRR